MEKGINLKTIELKQKIISNINEANIPPVLISYVLQDVLGEVSNITNNAIQKEDLEYKKSLEEKKIGEKEDDKCNESI